MKKLFFSTVLFSFIFCGILIAQDRVYTKEEICSAIYIIEGGEKTNYLYGIKSVNCDGKEDCKNVCFNTVDNNIKRYNEYGHKKFGSYLEFLQSRYCPLSDKGCEHWLPNLMFYLEK